jgi:dihydrofolate synthase/folylpolyglutamate synthase
VSGPTSLAQWLELLESRHPLSIELGLDRVRRVWERMGAPRPARTLVTVAGTNGKGSTVAYICSMLQALGCSQGSYTSPHLFSYNERMQIQGVKPSDRELVNSFEKVEAALDGISLSYFEFGTLAAIDWLSNTFPDFAVLEVGLGGRLDAVNILDTDCAVITSIGIDHTEYLGTDRESIGFEKAGIMRSGALAICGDPNPPQSILDTADSVGARLLCGGTDFSLTAQDSKLEFRQRGKHLVLSDVPMAGAHQLNNLAAALAAVLTVQPDAIDHPALLNTGVQAVNLPGRLQQWPGRPEILLDVGHNPDAARAIAQTLEARSFTSLVCVFGMLQDKRALEVAGILDSYVAAWYCAGLGGDRGQSGLDLSREVLKLGSEKPILDFQNVAQAMEAAVKNMNETSGILVFGSFNTVEQASVFLAGKC